MQEWIISCNPKKYDVIKAFTMSVKAKLREVS